MPKAQRDPFFTLGAWHYRHTSVIQRYIFHDSPLCAMYKA